VVVVVLVMEVLVRVVLVWVGNLYLYDHAVVVVLVMEVLVKVALVLVMDAVL
jgi:hypothetical protein